MATVIVRSLGGGVEYGESLLDSYIVELGTALTKVAVVGKVLVRRMFRTPASVRRVLHSARRLDECSGELSSFLHHVALNTGLWGSARPIVLLCHHDDNPLVVAAVQQWLRSASASHCCLRYSSPVAAMACFGLQSGIVVDVGFRYSRVAPLVAGLVVEEAALKAFVGFSTVLEALQATMQLETGDTDVSAVPTGGAPPDRPGELVLTAFILQHGVVAPFAPPAEGGASPRAAERDTVLCTPCPLPSSDGSGQPWVARPSAAVEVLFTASEDGLSTIPELIVECVHRCDPNVVLPHVRKNLVLTGGGAALTNFTRRVCDELLHAHRPLFSETCVAVFNPATAGGELSPAAFPVAGASIALM